MKHRVFIALGSNMGERATLLQRAIEGLMDRGIEVVATSQVIETEPMGFCSEHPFLNQVIEVQTELSPTALLTATQTIERELGRTRKSLHGAYSDRTCDLDIILYDQVTLQQEGLTIPHPRFRERAFVLAPLAEIAPMVLDPVTGKTIQELLWDVS